jgi:hypothetical protein
MEIENQQSSSSAILQGLTVTGTAAVQSAAANHDALQESSFDVEY